MASKKKTTPTPAPVPAPIEISSRKVKSLVVRLDEAENDLILFCRALKIDPTKVRDDLMGSWLSSRAAKTPEPTPQPPAAKKPRTKKQAADPQGQV